MDKIVFIRDSRRTLVKSLSVALILGLVLCNEGYENNYSVAVVITYMVIACILSYLYFDYLVSPASITIENEKLTLSYKGRKNINVNLNEVSRILSCSWRTGIFTIRLYTRNKDYIDIIPRWDFDSTKNREIVNTIILEIPNV